MLPFFGHLACWVSFYEMHRRFAKIQCDTERSVKFKAGKSWVLFQFCRSLCECRSPKSKQMTVLYQIYAFVSCLKSDQLQKLLLEGNLQDGTSRGEIDFLFATRGRHIELKTNAIHLELAMIKLNASGHCFSSIVRLVKII